MKIIEANEAGIAAAAACLRNGGLVAFPTETVYGLGGCALDDDAVRRIFAAKSRPANNPLIVHLGSLAQLADGLVIDDRVNRLATRFWPGPLTMVLKQGLNSPISPVATAGLDTLAIRIPSHPVARSLLLEAGLPVAAPSANRSGRISATMAAHVADDLDGAVDIILDAGASPIGLESTVIDLSVPDRVTLLREGAITLAALEEILPVTTLRNDDRIKSPGQLESHYAPNVPLRLNARSCASDEGFLGFGDIEVRQCRMHRNLSSSGDLDEAAANLYRMLRELDASGVSAIAVAPIPLNGVGAAINDRLRRAAAPR